MPHAILLLAATLEARRATSMTEPTREIFPTGAQERDLRFRPVDPDRARTLTRSQVESFNANGFLSPLPVLDTEKAARVRAYIDDLLASVLAANDRRNAYSINNYHLVCAGLFDLIREPRIVALVEDVLGPQFVCWSSHLFAKLPGDPKDVPFHQDAVYWPMTPSKSVTAWLAIDDTDAANAAMQFVPGSHLEGPLEHEVLGLDGSRVLDRRALGMETRSARSSNDLKAGEVSLHTDLLLHGSEPNPSQRRRVGLTLRYVAADVRLIEGFDFWRKGAVHLRAGDPDRFWSNRSRPEGEAPERMAEVWGEFDGQPLDAA